MRSDKENRSGPKKTKRAGGFNPMNVGYSADPDFIINGKNGVSGEGDIPYPPKPPKGGTGEWEEPTSASNE